MPTRYEILPPVQRNFLPVLAPLKTFGFVLYGGTAIALRLGHRISVDFDFFTDQTVDREAMRIAVPLLADAVTLQDEHKSWTVQLRSSADGNAPLKLSFFSGLGFGRVGRPSLDDERHLLIASLDDLLGHKLKVLLQRVEAKDYLDIVAMLDSGMSLDRGLGAAMALFSNFPPCEAVKALVYFDEPELETLSDATRSTLVAHADRIGLPQALPILSRRLAPSGPDGSG